MRGKTQFSKITALIKDKDRRAKKENPEGGESLVAYVDSARAALTASLGAKDLRRVFESDSSRDKKSYV